MLPLRLLTRTLLLGSPAARSLLLATPLLLLPLLPLSPLLLASAAGPLLLLSLLLGLAAALLVLPLLLSVPSLLVSALASCALPPLVLLALSSLLVLLPLSALLLLLRLLSIPPLLLLSSLASCALLLLLGLTLPSLLHLLIRRLACSGRGLLPRLALCADRCTGRRVAQAASLTGLERLWIANIVAGLDHIAGFAHGRGSADPPVADIVGANDLGIRNLDRSRQHARSHVVYGKRPADRGRDECRRNPRIDREAGPSVLDNDGLIFDHCFLDHRSHLVRRKNDGCGPRRGEIARANEHPDFRLLDVLGDDFFRCKRRPTDVPTARSVTPPAHECWPPFVSRDPDPVHLFVVDPAAIVEGDDAPNCFFPVFNPVPAIVVCVGPVADRVGTPVARTVCRTPHLAPARMPLPAAVRLESCAKLPGRVSLALLRRLRGRSLLPTRPLPLHLIRPLSLHLSRRLALLPRLSLRLTRRRGRLSCRVAPRAALSRRPILPLLRLLRL